MKKKILLIGIEGEKSLDKKIRDRLNGEFVLHIFISSKENEYHSKSVHGIKTFYGELSSYEALLYAAKTCSAAIISYKKSIREDYSPAEIENMERVIDEIGVTRTLFIKEESGAGHSGQHIDEYCSKFGMWG